MIRALRDLRPGLLAVRSQGNRPTCLAFATSAANENLSRVDEHLSVEYLYFHAVARTPGASPHAGTTMEAAAEALLHDGQPVETHWPYLDTVSDTWAPPSSAEKPFCGALQVGRLTFNEIAAELDADRPVVLGLLISDAFYVPDSEGRIVPWANDVVRGGHALLAIGHGLDHDERFLLVRNSWGIGWGLHGHAWIRQDYVEQHLHQTAAIVTR
ncbi:MAG: C1 family peptidase [Novosphingobium sp.]